MPDPASLDLRDRFPDWDGDWEELEGLMAEQEADDLRDYGKRDRIGRDWVLYLGMPASDGEWLLDPERVESALARDRSGDDPDIVRFIAALDDDEVELVHLYYYDRLSMRQAAERLGYRSVNSITKKLKAIHSKLEALLGQATASQHAAAPSGSAACPQACPHTGRSD